MTTSDRVTLSDTQQLVVDLVETGSNVLMLGSAGCGKSTVIKQLRQHQEAKNKHVYVTSTTGISAYNIQGITLHRYMGFGTGEGNIWSLLTRIRKQAATLERILNTHLLIIDEISMLSADLFEKVDKLLRMVRGNDEFFGGIQVVLSGDLLQLKPVIKKTKYNPNPDERLLFESDVFNDNFKKESNIVTLTTNFRQKGDTEYQQTLNNVRHNTLTPKDLETLEKALMKAKTDDIPHLVATNSRADFINKRQLEQLKGKSTIFNATFKKNLMYDTQDLKQMSEDYLYELKSQFKQKEMETITLKENCRVMLTRNLDQNVGLINGALGHIEKIEKGKVLVRFDNGQEREIEKEKWTLETDGFKVTATQIPLILAYSITIHKSQSLTLEKARMDLGNCFTYHMAYVALSRVKSLDGLYLDSFDPDKIIVDKKTIEYLDGINEQE